MTARALTLAAMVGLALALGGCAGGEGVAVRVRGVVTHNLHGGDAPWRQLAPTPSAVA